MRLNLGHHDLDPLLCHQRALMLLDELQMKPYVIENTRTDDGYRQAGDRKVLADAAESRMMRERTEREGWEE